MPKHAKKIRLRSLWAAIGALVLLAVLLAAAPLSHLPQIGSANAATVTRTVCTAPTYTTTNPEGTKSFTSGLYWVNNDAWNGTHAVQTIKACSPSSWSASIDQPTKSGQVETYPDTEYDVGGRTHLNTTNAVATFLNITSTFAETDPTTNGNNWDAGYDLWTTNWGKETMIWNQWEGGQSYWATKATITATLGGVPYKFYEIGSTCSTKTCERIFFRQTQVTSGSANILDAFKWEVSNGYLPATAKPTQLEYGVEICGTPGTETFPMTELSMTVNGGATSPVTTKPVTTKPKSTTPPKTTAPKGVDTLKWTKVHNNESTTGAYVTVTTATVGDVVLAELHLEPSSAEHFTSITDSNKRIAWNETPAAQITGTSASNNTEDIFYGVVTSAGPTKITGTHTGSNNFDGFAIAQEWHSTAGTTWSLVNGGGKEGTGKTVGYPSLTSGNAGGVYFGWSYPSTTGVIPTTKGGFTWKITNTGLANATNLLVYRGTLAAKTIYTPKGAQKSSGYYDSTGVIVQATGGTTPVTPPKTTKPVTTPPVTTKPKTTPVKHKVTCTGTQTSAVSGFSLTCTTS